MQEERSVGIFSAACGLRRIQPCAQHGVSYGEVMHMYSNVLLHILFSSPSLGIT